MLTPEQIRNDGFASLQKSLVGARERVYNALLRYGPCTTMALAAKANLSAFSVRPRITELCQLGLAKLHGMAGREGIYVAVPLSTVREHIERINAEPQPQQLQLI